MKQIMCRMSLFLVGILLAVACTDDKIVKNTDVEEGVAVVAQLKVEPSEFKKIQTRVADDYISDLYVIVFDDAGDWVSSDYFTGLSGLSGNISLRTTSGGRYIYGVANLQTSALSIEKERLDRIKSVDDLQKMMVTLSEETVGAVDGKFLMYGFWTNSIEAESPELCMIDVNGSINPSTATTTTDSYSLKLKRLQSRITFNVTYSGNNVQSFKVTEVNLKNIPRISSLAEGQNMNSTYFDVNKLATNAGNKSFTFYMLENRQTIKNPYPDTPDPYSSFYELREKKDGSNWMYAPEQATYVEIKGHYNGKAQKYSDVTDAEGNTVRKPVGDPQDVDADVVYYVHLGFVGNDAADFSSLRNRDYTYNMNITGVKSIVLEVEEGLDYPRGNGDIYYSDGENVITVDAHYAQKVLDFSYEKLGASNLILAVKVKSNNTVGFEEKDQDWLRFVENPEWGQEAVAFPGIDSKSLLTATQFVDRLKSFKDDPENEGKTIRFTCFINEYYPIGTDNGWKNYVNQEEDRIAQIICRTESGSGSNTIDAAYIIRQHPILSFYDINAVNNAWGIEWENETTDKQRIGNHIIEIGRPYGNPSGSAGGSYTKGRDNMISELGGNLAWYKDQWSTPSEDIRHRDYREDLEYAYAACMQRNRDENGDGMISGDEIKWYLPALYQYTDISIGMNILPQDAQLYSSEDYNISFAENNSVYWMFKHYVSNTGKKVFWAEEGGSYSDLHTGKGENDWENFISLNEKANNGARQFRCIRNLGAIDAFDEFVTYNGEIMDLSKVDEQALRRDFLSKGELKRHDERDVLSRPYKKFQVAKNTCGALVTKETYKFVGWGKGSYALSDKNGYYCKSNSVGILGYGTPNQLLKVGKKNGTYSENGDWTGRQGNGGSYVMPDQNGYYIKYVKEGDGRNKWAQTTPNTYVKVDSGSGFYDLYYEVVGQSNTEADYDWTLQNKQADSMGTSVCSYYSEESDGSDLGTWRIPNMRELLLIVNRAEPSSKMLSRTYYSFYLNDMLKPNVTQDPNGALSSYSIYSPGNSKSREGFSYSGTLVYLIDPGNAEFKVRCVRDK